MSRINPVNRADLDTEMEVIMAAGDEVMGFTSNDALVMAHKPEMLKAVLGMVQAIYQAGSVPLDLKNGCRDDQQCRRLPVLPSTHTVRRYERRHFG